MASSSSSSQIGEVLPLIPCPRCLSKVVSFVSRAGERFYKCVRKDAGLCSFMRSTDTYLPELARAGIHQPQVLHQPVAVHYSAPALRRPRRDQEFMDDSQAEIQDAHLQMQPQMQQSTQSTRGAAHCCSTDSQRTTLLLAATNFILVVALLFMIFGQQRS